MQLHIDRDEPTLWLYNVDGFARLHGFDTDGNAWTEYTLEPFDDGPMTDECADCGEEITSGWLCLDGGETICSSHVVIVTRKD